MALETGMKCIKILLGIFNLIFFLIGLILIVVGAVIQSQLAQMSNVLGTALTAVPIVIIIAGAIILIVAFFGCCGAWKENYCMVVTFGVFVLVILVLEIGLGIAAFSMRSQVQSTVQTGLQKMLDGYKSSTYMAALDKIQTTFTCCGVQSYTNWQTAFGNTSVPASCCSSSNPACLPDAPTTATVNQGCLTKLTTWVQNNMIIVAGIAIGVGMIEVIGMVFAFCLASAIKKQYEQV